ncbi:MAG: DUF4097 domain-containing protein [Verrucomicrobia bacterium]|nr:DUF4097 domain-containing protein [Verrucomicrobiota bacterium]
MIMKKTATQILLALAAVISLGGCAGSGSFAFMGPKQEKTLEKTLPAAAGGTLRLETDLGSVKVTSHSGTDVVVTTTLQAYTRSETKAEEWFDQFDVAFQSNEKDVEVTGRWKDRSLWRKVRMNVNYNIQVPEEYHLDIATSGGSISVSDLRGGVKMHTSGGSITVGDLEGEVDVHTSGGSISIGKVRGGVLARTSGGSISVNEADGPVDVKTSGGSIRLKNLRNNVNARTSGGSIHADLNSQLNEPAELRTSGGSIELSVPPGFKAELDAETSGGRVTCDVPITVRGSIHKTHLRGTLNGGGPLVTLHTSGGNVRISEH